MIHTIDVDTNVISSASHAADTERASAWRDVSQLDRVSYYVTISGYTGSGNIVLDILGTHDSDTTETTLPSIAESTVNASADGLYRVYSNTPDKYAKLTITTPAGASCTSSATLHGKT